MFKLVIAVILSLVVLTQANHNSTVTWGNKEEDGIDVSTTCSSSDASCFKDAGVTFIIPRGYQSNGKVDSQICTSLKAAQEGGIPKRDTYIFPCPTCSKSAADQVNELNSYLNSNCKSAWSGRMWLDVEGSQYWLGNSDDNRKWYQDLVDACKKTAKCGVYSSASQWSAIFGSTSYAYGSDLPLWYAHYDGKKTFSDYSPFGNWNKPHAKQYDGDTTECGMGVDKNWSEDSF